MSVGHPRGTHSGYVIGCCLIPLGICGLKNNWRRITYGIGCVWGMPSLSPLSSLASLISTNNAVDLSLRLAGSQFLGTDPSDSIIVNTNNIDAMNKERVKFPAR